MDSKVNKIDLPMLSNAIAMPVVVRTRSYDEKFYEEMAPTKSKQDASKMIDQIF